MERIELIRDDGNRIVSEIQELWDQPYPMTLAVAYRDAVYVAEASNMIPEHLHSRYCQKPRIRCDVSLSHAEGNLISWMARTGTRTKGLSLFVNRFPCLVCANAIGMARFKEVIVPTPDFDYKPDDYDFRGAMEILKRFDVDVFTE